MKHDGGNRAEYLQEMENSNHTAINKNPRRELRRSKNWVTRTQLPLIWEIAALVSYIFVLQAKLKRQSIQMRTIFVLKHFSFS
jgi:hypothetical protein